MIPPRLRNACKSVVNWRSCARHRVAFALWLYYAVYTAIKDDDGAVRVRPKKDRANILKHGVGFDEARRVFSDPDVIISARNATRAERRLYEEAE